MSTVIKPKPKFKRQGVDFADLDILDCFIYNDDLCMKTDQVSKQEAICLSDGIMLEDMCGEYVLLVDVEITWKRIA